VYDEKGNYVIIKVVCCSPEKVKQKIICKGGDTIKSIEIREIEKNTNPPEEEKPPKKTAEKPPETEKKPQQKNDPEPVPKLPLGPVCVPVRPCGCGTCCTKCCGRRGGGPCLCGHGTKPRPHAKPVPLPVPVPVPAYRPVGFGTCCTECYEGRDGGPCHYGHGRPPPCYDGYYYGRPVYDSYGGGYRCEETSSGCTIM